MKDTRYHSVNLTWSNPAMSGLHVLPVDLTAEEQARVQSHIDAIVDLWRARALAENLAATNQDPFALG